MELESQNQRDRRVEELWKKLDPQGTGELDLAGLQKGLRRIDHPLKNADALLKDIMKHVDLNGDGRIQYDEFRRFVEKAEQQLIMLFKSIDKNQDGRLNKDELRAAFRRAGLAVPNRRLNGFFDEIDMNNDGYISFDEWRDFLLFMPAHGGSSPLEAAMSYYSSIVVLNAEGDSMVSEETLEGLGTTGFLLQALFGSILKLAQPVPSPALEEAVGSDPPSASTLLDPLLPQPLINSNQQQLQSRQIAVAVEPPASTTTGFISIDDEAFDTMDSSNNSSKPPSKRAFELTDYLPNPGYFLAGALAGGVSRTATAPLDRMKVYLLVNTNTDQMTFATMKRVGPLATIRHMGKPIGNAITSLYKSGGLRTFFAGNGLNVVKIMPETAIKFGSYEAAKRALANLEGHGDPNHINPVSRFAAGGTAGMISQFCVYPLDTIKFRLQCETVQGGATGTVLLKQTVKKMYANGGVRAAYRGVTMGLIGMFPYSAIDMGMFELLKNAYSKHKAKLYGIHEEDAAPGNIAMGAIGATSGAIGATVVYPLNVLRTRLQTQGTAMHKPTYSGIMDVARKTYKGEGIRGMYKGLTPNLLKVAPALSITWVVYENSKKFMNLH